MMKKIGMLAAVIVLFGCSKKSEPIVVSPEELHQSIDKVIEIMIHDIFSPPVASRIFAYPNIAAYEIVALHNDNYASLAGQVKDLTPIPQPDTTKSINYRIAALISHIDVSKRLIFSEDKLKCSEIVYMRPGNPKTNRNSWIQRRMEWMWQHTLPIG
jgi:hypothetical protein